MAGRSWKDLRKAPQPDPATAPPSLPDQDNILQRASQQSPRLGQLLEQRQALQGRIDSLVSGNNNMDPRDAARFSVPTFAQRQAQQREWEQRQNALQQRNLERRRQNRTPETPPVRVRSRSSEASQWLSRRDSQPQDGVSRWLDQRDQSRQALREQLRSRAAPLERVSGVGRQLRQPLNKLSGQLNQLDRQLKQQGLDSERDELRRLGADKLAKANKKLDKYSKILEAPKKAAGKIDNQWRQRQNQMSGAMDRYGPYVERSRRRLSSDTGGSGDLFERMSRNRERALTRLQQRRQQEQRDEQRRERALRRRRETRFV